MKNQPITLQKLIDRATKGRPWPPAPTLRPNMVYKLIHDQFGLWCDFHAAPELALHEESEHDLLRMKRGLEFEEAYVREQFPAVARVRPEFGFDSLIATLKLMLAGVDAIYQPQLWLLRREVSGRGDLLVRLDGIRSDLGPFAYAVREIKHSTEVKPHQVLQGALYHHMVGCLQGFQPKEFSIVTPSKTLAYRYVEFTGELSLLLRRFREIRSNSVQPAPSFNGSVSPWRARGNLIARERDDLTLLPGIGPSTREKYAKKLGVRGIRDLDVFSLNLLVKALGEKAGRSLFFAAQAYRENRPVLLTDKPVTLPKADRVFHLDFETSDDLAPAVALPPHAYLAGLWDCQKNCFVQFIAKGAADEARMFREMLDYVGDPSDAIIYEWTTYEANVVAKAAARLPDLADRLLAFRDRLVDLKEVLKQQVAVPAPDWSLKSVAIVLGFRWRHDGFGAFDAMHGYWRWLEGLDDGSFQHGKDYHEDDVLAMLHVATRLTAQDSSATRILS